MTDIFNAVLFLTYPEFRVPDPDGLFIPQNAFFHNILVYFEWLVNFNWSVNSELWSATPPPLKWMLIVVKTVASLAVIKIKMMMNCDLLSNILCEVNYRSFW